MKPFIRRKAKAMNMWKTTAEGPRFKTDTNFTRMYKGIYPLRFCQMCRKKQKECGIKGTNVSMYYNTGLRL